MKSASGVKVTVPSAFSTAVPPVPLVTLAMLRPGATLTMTVAVLETRLPSVTV
ncbi:hypothetical protein NGA35_17455 [Pseudomonas stutzeri]|nr:hypothetical protein [Stutzerimonas stutzeri]